MKRIAFIIHGRIAQNTKLMREIESVFKGYDYKCYSTSYAYHAPVLTQQAIADGYNYMHRWRWLAERSSKRHTFS